MLRDSKSEKKESKAKGGRGDRAVSVLVFSSLTQSRTDARSTEHPQERNAKWCEGKERIARLTDAILPGALCKCDIEDILMHRFGIF